MKPCTSDAHKGRPKEGVRLVNPGVQRGSTVLFPGYEAFTAAERPFFYGRGGTPTHRALEESVAALEGADQVFLAPSGLAAVTLALLSFAEAGGHLLVTDSAYDPTRGFCEGVLRRMGVETEYYDPRIGAGIGGLVRPNTVAILAESPGSLTFEVQDLPALCEAGPPVIVDNTWGAGVHLKPLALGAAVSVQAATKYLGGHSDVFLGTVAASGSAARKVAQGVRGLGLATSPDDAALVHRGMRTLHRRLAVHEETGLALARWLEERDEVAKVMHPALPSHPDHALFARDFTGACGLFGAVLKRSDAPYLSAFFGALRLFGMGYSWGGYESLCIPTWPERHRTAVPWSAEGQTIRVHAGLEDAGDLIADLEAAFAAANEVPEAGS
ncbi:cystathionine beta-lyase [Parvularcula dongshanensis]|uniref:Cystathionine beta-lyase n=1 Tax=Parvularcula dongshanensis TaxID=1173995 RepID=A0A840I338_9PROT|nr:cystathionine beta-lyase [Parvularcula dongshanensis]MBB4658712.1 cystathionine beta-lyase [Parvularcula dongshanensis]